MKYKYLLFIAFSLVFSALQSQNSWYVSENGDDNTGNGSLNNPWATITKAMGENDVIDSDTIHIIGTITEDGVAEWGIQVMKDLIFRGESKETSIIQAASSNASANRRVFTIWDVADVQMINLSIRNGYINAISFQYGAGILNWGNLSLENCIVSENYCDNEFLGGGIYNQFGTLAISNTYIYSNYSYFGGAGLVNEGGTVDIENSSFALNYCQGNLAGGGAIYTTEESNMNITNCTFYYNLLGLNSFGGAIYIKASDGDINIELLNTSIIDNEAGSGSEGLGLFIENETSNSVHLSLKNCIISNGNSSNYAESGNGIINLNRTYTLCNDASLPNGDSNGNIDNTNPLIDGFMNHGGLTPTCALQSTSPAINSGTNEGAPETDQRGMPRSGICDIGSFEYQINMGIPYDLVMNDINIYPNPANDIIYVDFNQLEKQNIRFIIFNSLGEIMKLSTSTCSSKRMAIDISNLPSGIYYLSTYAKSKKLGTEKFIK